MGLDGISVNQLRVTPENNSAELSKAKFSKDDEIKVVDGLSQGQKVDPDRQNEHEKPTLQQSFSEQEDEEDNPEESAIIENIVKYDLSDSEKYCLELDEEKNVINIIEKSSKRIVQNINPEELSNFVSFLSNSKGTMVNRKF